MNGWKTKGQRTGILHRLLAIPGNVLDYMKGKASNLLLSAQMSQDAFPLVISQATAKEIRCLVARRLEARAVPVQTGELAREEALLEERIREETARLNRNNVTRTEAYLRMYERRPELHWAFLAHMVSRNGGWNMTDLKGDLLPRLLPPGRAEDIFAFLERANALIFQDAYPQLMLYDASRNENRSLFHLLPHFHVSSFMHPVWEHFWRERNSVALTVGLIVNEQNYIEGRVVRREPYRTLLGSMTFKAQSLLQLNVIVIPYDPSCHPSGNGTPSSNGQVRLAGLVLEDFSDLRERIEVGKKLYAILFGVPTIAEGARKFAGRTRHTGSRADFWPHLFDSNKKAPPEQSFTEKLDGCKLLNRDNPLYSPELAVAWKDRPMEPPERYDWFRDLSPLSFFESIPIPVSFEITNEFCFSLNKMELAILAGQQLPT